MFRIVFILIIFSTLIAPLCAMNELALADLCDEIIKTNGDVIQVKILDVSPQEISYKKCDNLEGPTYRIDPDEIFMIKYSNGSKDVIGIAEPELYDNKNEENRPKIGGADDQENEIEVELDSIHQKKTLPSRRRLQLGVFGGVAAVSLIGEEYAYLGYWTSSGVEGLGFGIQSGLRIEYCFSEKFSLISGAAFESKGRDFKFTFTDEVGTVIKEDKSRSRFHYVSVPILLKFSIGVRIRPFMNVGCYAARLLRQVNTYPPLEIQGSESGVVKIEDTGRYRSMDFGIILGLGISLRVSDRVCISLEARDQYGLMNICNQDISSAIQDCKVKTNAVSLLLGFSFGFGKKL
jgi:hypothetical protein